jgi:hypothetical protein
MDIRIHADTISDWKQDLVSDRNARFVWMPTTSAEYDSKPRSDTFSLCNECSGLWLADVQDVLVVKQAPSDAYLAYAKVIRSFSPHFVILKDLDPALSPTQGLLANAALLRQFADMRDGATYLLPYNITEDIERISAATHLPVAGATSHVVFDLLNNKCSGRQLCRDVGIRVPNGDECTSVGALRARLGKESDLLFPLLAKEANEESGCGHVLLASRQDADQFLKRLDSRPDADIVSYAIETFLNVPPESNFNFRLLVGQSGKITLTDLHRSWVYPPHFYGRRSESPHGFDFRTVAEIYSAADKLGTILFNNGFTGPAGIDGVISIDGTVYPALDINPRLTGDIVLTNLIKQFALPYHAMEIHRLDRVDIEIGFNHVETALHHFGIPAEGTGGVVVLGMKRITSVTAQAAGLQTVKIKTLSVSTSIEGLRSLVDDVRKTLQNTCPVSHNPSDAISL